MAKGKANLAVDVGKVLEERQRTRLTATLEEIAKQRGRPTPKFILDLLGSSPSYDAAKFSFAGVDFSAGILGASFTTAADALEREVRDRVRDSMIKRFAPPPDAFAPGTFANTFDNAPPAMPSYDDSAFKKVLDTLRDNMLSAVMPPPPSAIPGCDCEICRDGRPYNVVPRARHELAEARARELERTVSLKHFPIEGTKWRIAMSNGSWLEDVINLELLMPVLDRDNGAPRAQSFMMNVPIGKWIERPIRAVAGELAAGLRKFILEALTHEVDESIHVGTERVFDPHRPRDMFGAIAARFSR